MKFHFYEITPEAYECKEYVELENWNEATSYGRDLADEWRNRVRIYEDGSDYSEIVGLPRSRHIEIGVDAKVNKIIKQGEKRERCAMERAKK